MGLEAISEDPIDTKSAAQPEMADVFVRPMMDLLQRITDSLEMSLRL